MEGDPNDGLMAISLKSEPIFQIHGVEIEDVQAPLVKKESDPLQEESPDVKRGLTSDPVEMEVSEAPSGHELGEPSSHHVELNEVQGEPRNDLLQWLTASGIEDVEAPLVKNESDPFQMESAEVKCRVASDPIEMKVSGARSQQEGLPSSHRVELNLVQDEPPNDPLQWLMASEIDNQDCGPLLDTHPKIIHVEGATQGFNEVCDSTTISLKSEPAFRIGGVKTEDVEAPLVKKETDPFQVESPEVKCGLTSDPVEMEVSEAHSRHKLAEPSSHHVELNEVQGEPQNDPLQWVTASEIDSQDRGPWLNTVPKVIRVEDQAQGFSEVSNSTTPMINERRDLKRVHAARRHACDLCDYRARRKRNLINHRMIHTGEKPFRCDLCDHATRQKCHLAVHRMIHTGERPYKCDLCDYSARKRSTLRLHFKRNHERDPSKDPLHIEPAQGESTDVRTPTHVNGVQHSSLNHLSLGFIEVFSSDGSSTSSLLRKCLTGEIAKPSPSGGPLQCKFDEQDQPPNGPSPITLHQFACEPDMLQLELGGEHRKDNRSCGFEPASTSVSNVEFNAGITRDLKPADVMSQSKTDPSKWPPVGPSEKLDEPSLHPSRIDLNEVQYVPENDPLQLEVSEMNSQDCEPAVKSEPEVIVAEDSSATSGMCNKYLLSEHMNTPTGENPFLCDQCDCRFPNRRSLARHKVIYSGERPFACDKCHFSTRLKFSLVRHMKIHTRDIALPDPDSSKVELNMVSYASRCRGSAVVNKNGSSESFQQGKIMTEDTAMPDLVGEPSNGPLQSDLRNKPGGPSREPEILHSEDKRCACEIFGYGTVKKSNLKADLLEHTGERPFACDLCDYSCSRRINLILHMKYHSHAGEDSSHDELRKDSSHDELRKDSSHGELRKRSLRITCEFCDYLFTTKAAMTQHIMTRHSEICFSCDVCNFKVFDVRSLEVHKETHTKPCACHICDHRAEEERDLANHMNMIHGRVKLFACSICECKFDESLLLQHIMSDHTDMEECSCYFCDYKASNVKGLEQHVLTTHIVTAPKIASSLGETTDAPTSKIEGPTPRPVAWEYLCYACDYKASRVAHVEQHILSTHVSALTREVAAPPEDAILDSPADNLNVSTSSNVDFEEYFCHACDFKADSVPQAQQHILLAHSAPVSATSFVDLTTDTSCSSTSE